MIILCAIIAGILPVKALTVQAAVHETGMGDIYVYNVDNDYKDGKYRFNQKIVFKPYYENLYYVCITKQYLTNSAGKKVATWKDWNILNGGGEKIIHYAVDFSKLPSDTYTLHYTVGFQEWNGACKSYVRSVTHSSGKITYKESKYTWDTNGYKNLKITFNCVGLKGKTPKLEVYNSKGTRIYSRTAANKVGYDNTNYYFTWNMCNSSGDRVANGTYTFKFLCNGKSCSKKLNIKVK